MCLKSSILAALALVSITAHARPPEEPTPINAREQKCTLKDSDILVSDLVSISSENIKYDFIKNQDLSGGTLVIKETGVEEINYEVVCK